jgi:hypothetical protein
MTLEDANWRVNESGLSRTFRATRWHILNEAALQSEIHEYPGLIRKPLVWVARQQWDRNWKRRYAELLSEQPELIIQGEKYAV